MERRFILFLTLSFLLLTINALLNARHEMAKQQAEQPAAGQAGPEQPAADKEQNAVEKAEGAKEAVAGAGQAAVAAADAGQAAVGAQEPEPPLEYVTLGSLDPSSDYRLLVTLTNQGAGVKRVELANPKYLDIHDRGGYLGDLELTPAPAGGLIVNAVGPGTPAANAGLQVGDRVLEAGGTETAPIASADELAKLLKAAKPKAKFTMVVERAGARQSLVAELARRPLEVIRPESENVLMRTDALPPGFVESPSFLMTLESIEKPKAGDQNAADQQKAVEKQKIAEGAQELPGVNLRDGNWKVVAHDQNSVTFERTEPKSGLTFTKRYVLAQAAADASRDPDAPLYDLTLELTVKNTSGEDRKATYRLDGPNGLPVEGWWYARKVGRSGGGLRDVLGRYFGADPQQQAVATIVAGKAPDFEGPSLAYMGVDAQYFCVAMIPLKKDADEAWIAGAKSILIGPAPAKTSPYEIPLANVSFRLSSEPIALKPGESATHKFQIFAGPKRPELLVKYAAADNPAYSLSDFVYYGWFGPIARAMVGILHAFYSVVRNYGLAVIMLTVLVRGCMFPISRGQAKSLAKMQLLKPEMDRIKEKYKGDQQKQAQAMQQLYRKHGVNPMAGCLPMVIQLPVFIGLYRGLAVDVELRQAPLFGLAVPWCSNLAAPDMLWNWSRWMPDWFNNGQGLFALGPYLNVLPLVTIVLFIMQQRMFTPDPTNEQQAMQQKIMKYMSVFMGVLFYKVASGLCLYFIASSAWGIAERKLIPPPTAAGAAAGAAGDGGSSKRSTPAVGDSRPPRNGQASGKGSKAKRR